jgi:hypothetical protein
MLLGKAIRHHTSHCHSHKRARIPDIGVQRHRIDDGYARNPHARVARPPAAVLL